MQPIEWKTISGAIGGTRVYLFVTQHNRVAAVDFADPLSKISNQFVQGFVLSSRGEIAIEITHQANAERNVIEIVAVDVSACELNYPTIADFDLPVSARGPVTNDEMIGKAVRHSPDVPMIVVEDPGIALPSPAVVDHDILPAVPGDARFIDGPAHSRS
jgi:hypothetical protein